MIDNIWSDGKLAEHNSALLKLIGEVKEDLEGDIYYVDEEGNNQPLSIKLLEKAAIGIYGNNITVYSINNGELGYLKVDINLNTENIVYPYQLKIISEDDLKLMIKESQIHYLIRYRFLKE